MKIPALIAFIALVAVACGEDMEDVSQVTKLRVLAIQAEPPEIRPGQGTTLRVLWADPNGDGREVTFFWMACKGYLAANTQTGEGCEPIWMPQIATASESGDRYVIWATPQDILDGLPPDEDGVKVTAILVVCAGGEIPSLEELADAGPSMALEDLCRGGDQVIAFKTFKISTSENPNTNPKIDRLYFNKVMLLPASQGGTGVFQCTAEDGCRDRVPLKVYFTDDSYQTYEKTVFGETEVVDERTYVSWFVTGGEMGEDRSGTAEPPGPYENNWLPPREGGEFTLWAVAHDVRGGASWETYAISALP